MDFGTMTDDQIIKQFVNDVYLTKFNRFVDTLLDASPDEDAVAEIAKVVRWASMFCDELELERDFEGQPVNWSFLRDNSVELATISSTSQVVLLPTTPVRYRKLVVAPNRPVTINFDTSVVASFGVVEPDQITKRTDDDMGDRVAVVNRKLIFSRPFKTTEFTGKLVGDALRYIPRLTTSDATMLRTVPYYELLVLGVAKNATLPGIVEGGLSPSMTQKYNDLLEGAKAESAVTSELNEMRSENFGYIGGVW
jgi:hypothetical protein